MDLSHLASISMQSGCLVLHVDVYSESKLFLPIRGWTESWHRLPVPMLPSSSLLSRQASLRTFVNQASQYHSEQMERHASGQNVTGTGGKPCSPAQTNLKRRNSKSKQTAMSSGSGSRLPIQPSSFVESSAAHQACAACIRAP